MVPTTTVPPISPVSITGKSSRVVLPGRVTTRTGWRAEAQKGSSSVASTTGMADRSAASRYQSALNSVTFGWLGPRNPRNEPATARCAQRVAGPSSPWDASSRC